MALAAGIASFAAELEAIEKVGYTSVGEAADAFASAFANFFGYATLNGLPLTPGTNLTPTTVAACTGALIPAFTTPNTPTSSSLSMQAAILAYLNTGVATMWPGLASAAAPVGPTLDTFLVPTMIAGMAAPKLKLATKIMEWIMAGAQITVNIPPGTMFII
jgi:hypothetical protein